MNFDPKKPTALFVGRYQPFHAGHKALILEGLKRVGQVCITVRDTGGTDSKNPFDFEFVKSKIEEEMGEYMQNSQVIQIPNITNIFYGRGVGYSIEQIHLGEEIESISATEIRKKILT